MPFPPLLEALEEKTRGRVIRLDHGIRGAAKAFEEGQVEVDDGGPGRLLRSRYIDYRIPHGKAPTAG